MLVVLLLLLEEGHDVAAAAGAAAAAPVVEPLALLHHDGELGCVDVAVVVVLRARVPALQHLGERAVGGHAGCVHRLGDDLAGQGAVLHLGEALGTAVVAAAGAVDLAALEVGEDVLVAAHQVAYGAQCGRRRRFETRWTGLGWIKTVGYCLNFHPSGLFGGLLEVCFGFALGRG